MKQKDPHEMAGGDLVKVKAGFWCVGLQDEVPYQSSRLRENQPEISSQEMIELSTISHGSTPLPFRGGPTSFWAVLYHLTLSQSSCVDHHKRHTPCFSAMILLFRASELHRKWRRANLTWRSVNLLG